jgi:hypothetical protein
VLRRRLIDLDVCQASRVKCPAVDREQ